MIAKLIRGQDLSEMQSLIYGFFYIYIYIYINASILLKIIEMNNGDGQGLQI